MKRESNFTFTFPCLISAALDKLASYAIVFFSFFSLSLSLFFLIFIPFVSLLWIMLKQGFAETFDESLTASIYYIIYIYIYEWTLIDSRSMVAFKFSGILLNLFVYDSHTLVDKRHRNSIRSHFLLVFYDREWVLLINLLLCMFDFLLCQ